MQYCCNNFERWETEGETLGGGDKKARWSVCINTGIPEFENEEWANIFYCPFCGQKLKS